MSESLSQCRDCNRLVEHREAVATRFPDYHCRPVPAFGDADARILFAGLAPGLHGANRTGIPFTGDASGQFLFGHLARVGWAQPTEQGIELAGIRITNVVKCLPPGNKPLAAEVNACRRYLIDELDQLPTPSVIVTLGRIAHDAVLRALGLRLADMPFSHGAVHHVQQQRWLVASYHPSRYNINTGRMNDDMFAAVLARVQGLLA